MAELEQEIRRFAGEFEGCQMLLLASGEKRRHLMLQMLLHGQGHHGAAAGPERRRTVNGRAAHIVEHDNKTHLTGETAKWI